MIWFRVDGLFGWWHLLEDVDPETGTVTLVAPNTLRGRCETRLTMGYGMSTVSFATGVLPPEGERCPVCQGLYAAENALVVGGSDESEDAPTQ